MKTSGGLCSSTCVGVFPKGGRQINLDEVTLVMYAFTMRKAERNAGVIAMRRQGHTYREIGKACGISHVRAMRLCKRKLVEQHATTGAFCVWPPVLRLPKSAYSHVRWHAGRRKIAFALALEDFINIVTLPCIYGGGTHAQGFRIGIDRKENSVGYVRGNCAPCCFRHNVLRFNNFTHEEFLDAVCRYPGLRACGNKKRKS